LQNALRRLRACHRKRDFDLPRLRVFPPLPSPIPGIDYLPSPATAVWLVQGNWQKFPGPWVPGVQGAGGGEVSLVIGEGVHPWLTPCPPCLTPPTPWSRTSTP